MAETTRRTWAAVAIMSIGAFVVVVNATLLSPLLRPIATEFGISESHAGRLGTVASIVGAVAAILVAPMMDRVSLRAWVFWQSLLLIVVSLGSALAPTFLLLMVARAGSGASMMLAKCLAASADLFQDERRRNRAIGILVSATTAGVIGGLPVIALVESMAGWRWAFAALLVPLGILLVGIRWLPREASTERQRAPINFAGRYREVLTHRSARLLLLAQGTLGLAYIGWLTYLGAYVEIDFGAGGRTLSLVFLVAGAGELAANNVIPVALRRWTPPAVFAMTGAGWAVALAAGGIGTGTLWMAFVTTTFISMCSAAQYIVISILLLDAIPAARGTVMSLASAAMGIGGAIGVALAGFVLERTDDYGHAFRVLALILPAGMIAVYLSRRVSPAAVAIEPAV